MCVCGWGGVENDVITLNHLIPPSTPPHFFIFYAMIIFFSFPQCAKGILLYFEAFKVSEDFTVFFFFSHTVVGCC
jgi:hypothetical protein